MFEKLPLRRTTAPFLDDVLPAADYTLAKDPVHSAISQSRASANLGLHSMTKTLSVKMSA
jgi:hypothetical protein